MAANPLHGIGTHISASENPNRQVSPLQATETPGVCLLSLDGGGVRGLSTLYVLQKIMNRLNHERLKEGHTALKPCDIFDLMAGTSTGW